MKKLLALLMLTGALTFGFTSSLMAQDDAATSDTEQTTTEPEVVEPQVAAEEEPAAVAQEEFVEEATFHQAIKEKFIEGGWGFMSVILLCLILGLAIAIERI